MALVKHCKNGVLAALLAVMCAAAAVAGTPASGPDGPAVVSTADSVAIAMADSLIDAINLDEVIVVGKIKPIEVKGDTTVINASSFNVRDDDNLEELVRRIPGMEYDPRTGQLSFRGKTLNEIMINGQEFFGRDFAKALENLPVELISKLRIYDKADEQEVFTGVKDDKANYVLDIKTTRELNNSAIYSAEVGAGNCNKYQASAQGSYFKIGGNHYGVDLSIGNRYETTSYRKNRQDRLTMNVNHDFNDHLRIMVHGGYNHGISGGENSAYTEQYLPAGNSYNYSAGNNVSRRRGLDGMFNLTWKDKKYLVGFNASVNRSHNFGDNSSRRAAFSENPGLSVRNPFGGDDFDRVPDELRVNDNSASQLSDSKTLNYSANVSVGRKLNSKGSTLSLTAGLSDSNGDNGAFSETRTTYYRLVSAVSGGDSLLYRKQFADNPTRNRDRNIGLKFVHQVNDNLSFNLAYRFHLSTQRVSRSTYDLSGFASDGQEPTAGRLPDGYQTAFVDSLSNYSRGRSTSHEVELATDYHSEHLTVSAVVGVMPERRTLDQKTGLLQGDTVRKAVNFAPRAFVMWNTEAIHLNFSYSGRTEQPSLSQLFTMTDNSNPLYVTRGNPRLKASYSQDFSLNFRHEKTGLGLSAYYNNTFNRTAQAVTYNPETGGQESFPVNVNGDMSANTSVEYSKFFNRGFLLDGRVGVKYSRSVSLINENHSADLSRSVTEMKGSNVRVRVGLMKSWGFLQLGGVWDYSDSKNDLRDDRSRIHDFNIDFDSHVSPWRNLELESRVVYNFRRGTYVGSGDDSQVVWNLSLGWSFLKRQAAEIKVEWNDILNDRKSFTRRVTSTGLNESYSQQIGGYFMVTFRYRFSSFS